MSQTTTPPKPPTPIGLLQVGSTEVRLWTLPFSIGRSSTNTLTIRDRSLSRSHCEIHRTAEGYELRNLSDSNPTCVNGQVIEAFLLSDGDEINVHDHRFVFRLSDDAAEMGDELESGERPVAVAETAPEPTAEQAPEAREAPAQAKLPEPPVTAPRPVPAASSESPMAMMLSGLVLFGMLGMAALLLNQNSQSNQATRQVIEQLGGLRQEFSALHEELETAREAYTQESKRNDEAWRKLLAARAAAPAQATPQPRRQAPQPKKRTPPPVAKKTPPPAKKQPAPQPKQVTPPAAKKPTTKKPPKELTRKDPPKPLPVKKDPVKKDPLTKDPGTIAPKATPSVTFFGHKIDKKRVVFVLDKSSSMKPVMARLRAEMDSAIDAMTPDYLFNLIFFDENPKFFSRKMVKASPKYKRFARTFVKRQQAAGYTDPLPALRAALRYPKLEAIVFLTDGNINAVEFKFLKALLEALTSGKGFKGRKIRFYLVPVVRNDRIDQLLALAEKQKF